MGSWQESLKQMFTTLVLKNVISQINLSKILHVSQVPVSYFYILMRIHTVNKTVKVEITLHTELDLKIILNKEVQAQDTTCGICSFLDVAVATYILILYPLTCPVVVHPNSADIYPVH